MKTFGSIMLLSALALGCAAGNDPGESGTEIGSGGTTGDTTATTFEPETTSSSTTTGEDDSTPAFDKLDEALSQGIEQSRNQLRSDIVNARRVLSGSTVGAAALSVVAAISVALLWLAARPRRLRGPARAAGAAP